MRCHPAGGAGLDDQQRIGCKPPQLVDQRHTGRRFKLVQNIGAGYKIGGRKIAEVPGRVTAFPLAFKGQVAGEILTHAPRGFAGFQKCRMAQIRPGVGCRPKRRSGAGTDVKQRGGRPVGAGLGDGVATGPDSGIGGWQAGCQIGFHREIFRHMQATVTQFRTVAFGKPARGLFQHIDWRVFEKRIDSGSELRRQLHAQAPRGANRISEAPARQMSAPATSHLSGRRPSANHSQPSEAAM